jgi:hypothetical protein
VEPFVEARLQDFVANDEYCAKRSLLTFRRATLNGKWDDGDKNLFVESGVYSFWCDDGELRELAVFMDEDGRSKNLLPNHRANALIDAGRFTSKDRIQFNEGQNQSLKEHHGCNFVYGDVVCKIPIGTAGPDHSVYNNNPLWYIVQPREPTTEMIDTHGKELARNKLVPTRKMNIPRGTSFKASAMFFQTQHPHSMSSNVKSPRMQNVIGDSGCCYTYLYQSN